MLKKLDKEIIKAKVRKIVLKEYDTFFIFALCFGVLIVWLIGFYPGVMTYDSVYQWGQALAFKSLDNAMPYVHTLFLAVMQRIWGSPASVNLIHTTSISLILSFIYRELKLLGVKRKYIILGILITILQPALLIFNITLWKDIPYTYLLFLQIPLLIHFYRTKKQLKFAEILVMSFVVAIAVSLRYNGVPFIIVVPFSFWLIKAVNLKKSVIFFLSIGIIYIFIQFIFINFFPVNNSRMPYLQRFHRIQLVGALLNADVQLEQKDKEIITEFMPDLEKAKACYSCIQSNWIFICPAASEDAFKSSKNLSQFDQTTTKLFVQNYKTVLKDRVCMFENILSYKKGSNYLYSTDIYPNSVGITQKRAGYSSILLDYLSLTESSTIRVFFWFHGFTSILYIIGLFIAIIKRDRLVGGISIMLLANLPTFFILNVSNDFRYLFILQLSFPLYLVIVLSRVKIKNLKFSFKHIN